MLRLVDAFTSATCYPGASDPSNHPDKPRITEPFSCALQPEKERCVAGGGSCEMTRDGYYIVHIICVIVGVFPFVMYIRPKVLHLQDLPLKAWRLATSR